jgi:hypothetical protein
MSLFLLLEVLALTLAGSSYASSSGYIHPHSPFKLQLQSRAATNTAKAALVRRALELNSSNVPLADFFNGTDLQ